MCEYVTISHMNLAKIFKYYWPHIKKYKLSFFITFVLYALGTIGFNVLAPILYKNIVDLISSVGVPAVVIGSIFSLLLTYGIVFILSQILWSIGNYTLTYSQSNIMRDLYNDSYKRLQQHSYGFFTGRFVGSLVAKVKRYVDSFETIHDMVSFRIFLDVITLVGTVVVVSWFSHLLGIIFIAWISIFSIITFWLIRKKVPMDLDHAKAKSRTTGNLADLITNVLNIKMFASEYFEQAHIAKLTKDEQVKRSKTWNFHNLQMVIQGFLSIAFKVGSLGISIYLWSIGSVTAGTVVLVYAYTTEISEIVWQLGRNMTRTVEAVTDAKEMVEIFEQDIDVKDSKNLEKCAISNGEIDIRNITFAYENGKNIFQGFSMKIFAGEHIGLVGHSGSGKTTITKLLLRFADLQEGEILIDGQNISRIKQSELRKNISYVPQEPMLFHRTLAENIGYAKPGASKEEIIEVAKRAHAHEFIQNLPKGYNTLVGERGIKLSGGERQRVAIARAMLKDAPIIILDEATSALDSISEYYVQDALDSLMNGKTVIVVAHRLSTIQHMDRIVVFENGEITEQGTHQDLLGAHGAYSEFWNNQVNGMLPD